MKKFMTKFGSYIAAMAVMVTAMTANAACVWFTHQEELPDEAKQLRKF